VGPTAATPKAVVKESRFGADPAEPLSSIAVRTGLYGWSNGSSSRCSRLRGAVHTLPRPWAEQVELAEGVRLPRNPVQVAFEVARSSVSATLDKTFLPIPRRWKRYRKQAVRYKRHCCLDSPRFRASSKHMVRQSGARHGHRTLYVGPTVHLRHAAMVGPGKERARD